MLILQEEKVVEWRSWKTDYRGDLLICASSAPWWAGSICKHALCVVKLVDIVPFERKHLAPAFMEVLPSPAGYAWILENVRFVEPFELKGKLRIYDVDDSLIKVMSDGESRAAFAEKHYKPLIRWEDKELGREVIEADWNDWIRSLQERDERGE